MESEAKLIVQETGDQYWQGKANTGTKNAGSQRNKLSKATLGLAAANEKPGASDLFIDYKYGQQITSRFSFRQFESHTPGYCFLW